MTESPDYPARFKYNAPQAKHYQRRKPGKHRAEMRLIDRAFELVAKTSRVLDAPCGGGRVTLHLARRGYHVTGADLSPSMLQIAQQNMAKSGVTCTIDRQDLEQMTYPDRAFDTVVCFRLFHHFPTPAIRQRVVTELCRVAAQQVVLSYFSPASLQTLKRKFTGKDRDRFPTPLPEVKQYFANAGFQFVKDFAQMPIIHTLHVAVFERITK